MSDRNVLDPKQTASRRPPAPQGAARAGTVYGYPLSLLDAPTLATWSGAAGFMLTLSRWYARVFGYPELAAHRRFRYVRAALDREGGRTVLDLGAGNGLYSIADAMARPGTVHVVADVSRRHVRRACDTGLALGAPVSGMVCRAEALPLATASVETVLLIEVLQFVEGDLAAFAEVARVLRRGGAWLCEQDWAARGVAPAPVVEDRLRKRRAGYTVPELHAAAARVGLEIVWTRPVSGAIGRWWESIDGRLFRASRLLHLLLFPLVRAVAWATTPAAREGRPGTVLYLFRKPGGGGVTGLGPQAGGDHFPQPTGTA